jgi:hypothetical protein
MKPEYTNQVQYVWTRDDHLLSKVGKQKINILVLHEVIHCHAQQKQ